MTEPNVHSIDTSSFQPRNLTRIIQAYRVKHVVVHLYLSHETPDPQHSKDQINSARDNGCSAGGYVFPYRPADDPERMLWDTLELCSSVGLELPCAWIDAEPNDWGDGPDEAWFDSWYDLCASVQMPTGPYCNRDWMNTHSYMPKYGEMGHPLWLANWDGVADVTQGHIPAGWTELAGKQWEVAHGPLGEIDRDVFREEWTVYQAPPVTDPCADLRAENDRLRAGIDDAITMLTQLKGG